MDSMNVDSNRQNYVDAMENSVRNGFIRKVYGILSVQLLITGLIAIPIQQMPKRWLIENQSLAQAAMLMSLVAVLGVSCCCANAARVFPWNYMFLLVVTVCEAVIVGFISAMYTGQSVLMAAFLTAGIFCGLTIYAFKTKSDFTGMGGYLTAALLGLMLTGFVCMLFPASPLMQKLMAGFGAILFSFYIVYDTQLIVGGKHSKHSFGVDDYAFAALNIYLDIINLFLYLLELFGDRRD